MGFVEVILITAGIVGQMAGVDVDDVGGEGPNEIDIVADENQRAFALIKRVGEGIDARHV